MKKQGECFIWTNDGLWLQTINERGDRVSNHIGRVGREHARIFAQSRGIAFVDMGEELAPVPLPGALKPVGSMA